MLAVTDIQFDEIDLVRSITRESFFEFVVEFWDTVVAEPFIDNWHIHYICARLQRAAERVFRGLPKDKDMIINVPFGSTKTLLACIMFPSWIWGRMPHASIIGSSYTVDGVAMDASRKNRNLVKSDKYQQCFPNIKITHDMDAKGHFANTQKGERNTTGTGCNVTGRHGDFILIDDPVDPMGSRSEADLKKANLFITETLWSRKKKQDVTPTILIMQRLHQNDPTAMLIETLGKENIEHICLPGEITDDVNPPELKTYYTNGLLDPVRGSRKILKEHRKTLLEYGYAGQILQRPVPEGGQMFKIERINIDTPPQKFQKVIRYWDKAGTQDGGARTAGVKIAKDARGRIWILHVEKGQWGMDTREARIKQTAIMDGKTVIVWVEQEPGSGGKDSAELTIKNLIGWRVRADKVGQAQGNKIMRAEPFADQVNGGNVYMVEGLWNKEFLDEHEHFPYSKFKDQVDAASGGFNQLNKSEPFVGVLGTY